MISNQTEDNIEAEEQAQRKPQEKNMDEQEQRDEKIKEYGQVEISTQSGKSNIHCLTIIGEIEGHMILPPQNKTTKYEHIIPQLVSVQNDDFIEGMLILLNTVGGDVEAGLAISELISSLCKPTVSLVLGGSHSIGVPLAVSADYSFIAPTATMTIHPVRMNGLVIGVAQTFEYFKKMQDRIVDFVIRNSDITNEKYQSLMLDTAQLAKDVGTIIVGQEAVDVGLIHEVGGLSSAVNKLNEMIEEGKKEKTEN